MIISVLQRIKWAEGSNLSTKWKNYYLKNMDNVKSFNIYNSKRDEIGIKKKK